MSLQRSDAFTKRDLIKARAYSLGFCLCGVTTSAPLDQFYRYENWIDSGCHAGMNYMQSERHFLTRQDPTFLAPWVKSIIVFAWPYRLNRSSAERTGHIAGYVSDQDYHIFIPHKIQELVDDLPDLLGQPVRTSIYCDSQPILERELAVRAGLGWIGKNSNLISPKFGSAFLLAELFLDVELPADQPFEKDFCGTCQRCLNACPTNCILPDRLIDARNCISYLTIENKNQFSTLEAEKIGNQLFGCDICQTVCPWNRAIPAQESCFAEMPESELIAGLCLTQEQFSTKYHDSAIQRSKRRGWVRNLCTVLVNLKTKSAKSALAWVADHDTDAACRAEAASALTRINGKSIPSGLNKCPSDE